ncbi:MAG: UDP-glucose dehydrogenase family protein [Bacillota bacterium]|jgi:UDPglucose 6-dehydrogenase
MKICVVGTGYVGLVSGAVFADIGHEVICIDNNQEKIEKLKAGIMPIFEPGLKELVDRNTKGGRLSFSSSLEKGVQFAEVIFIAVGTPSLPNGEADLSQVEEVAKGIAETIDGYKVIVNKSTVPVGTGAWVKKIIKSNQQNPADFDVVSNPEFLREGSAIHDTLYADRVVIGADNEKAGDLVAEIHRPLNAPIIRTNIPTAEMIKYASNAFLAMKISYVNGLSNICELLGADILQVSRGMGLDKRIGKFFLDAGLGFGGACFPKDVKALVKISEKAGYNFELIKNVISINERQRFKAVEKLKEVLGTIEGRTICLWGLSFKPNTNDMREAPSIDICREIQRAGGKVKVYDPAAMDEAKKYLVDVEYCRNLYEAAAEADAIILVTEWEEFKNVDFNYVKLIMKSPIIIDGRNLYSMNELPEKGFIYRGIGRG